jgi:hypothetical protein
MSHKQIGDEDYGCIARMLKAGYSYSSRGTFKLKVLNSQNGTKKYLNK